MTDAAEKAAEDEERAMAQFEDGLRQQRIAESMRPHDPSAPVKCADCGVLVDRRRLAAYPRTRRCTPCASAIERRYANGGPR